MGSNWYFNNRIFNHFSIMESWRHETLNGRGYIANVAPKYNSNSRRRLFSHGTWWWDFKCNIRDWRRMSSKHGVKIKWRKILREKTSWIHDVIIFFFFYRSSNGLNNQISNLPVEEDSPAWECVWRCKTSAPVTHMAFSPDSTLFATAGNNDRLVKIWFENKHCECIFFYQNH